MNALYPFDSNQTLLPREHAEGKALSFSKGLAAASLEDPSRPRGYDWTISHVIQPLLDAGTLDNGGKGRV